MTEPRLILHLTHFANLESILAEGGLWSPNHMPAARAPHSIAHETIQSRRAVTRVPVGPGGTLHDYVPFYFGARSPMLFANHKGYVASNPHGQRGLVHLVSSVERVVEGGLRWAFSDGHAAIRYTRFFDQLADLDQVDWAAVHALYWADTPAQPDRKRRKQAEFLVFRFMPVADLLGIAVCDAAVAEVVERILQAHRSTLRVVVEPGWYY